jgi:hypothetical protein
VDHPANKDASDNKDAASSPPNKSTQQRHQEKNQKDIKQYLCDPDCSAGDSQKTECRSN